MTEALPDTALQHSCLRRQLAELELIRAMYPGKGEFYTTEAEATAVEMLDALDDNTPVPDFLFISFTLHLEATKVGGRHANVGFSFPRGYPETDAVRVNVECGGQVTKHQHEIVSLGAQAAANEMVGSEAVLQVLQRVQELAWEMEGSGTLPPQHSNSEASHELKSSPWIIIQRKLMWFHHIKSSQKRKNILEWGTELQLGGFCKPGFPGVLIFEGEADDVAEFVKRIQRLRWQALQIRGEEEEVVLTETQNLESFRRFPIGIRELPESGMSELAGKCRDANLEQLFLTALKISR